MPSFKIIGLLVLEKKIFKSFYHIWAWRPSWSCDLDHLYKLSFPLPKKAPHTIWLWLAKRFQRRRCLNIVDDKDNYDGRQSKEKKIFKSFYHIWAWRPSWSCDLDHLYKLSFPLPKEAPHKIWLWLFKRFQWRRCLKMVVIYKYIVPGQGNTTPWGQIFFINSIIQAFAASVQVIVLCCKFSPTKWLYNSFPHSNV